MLTPSTVSAPEHSSLAPLTAQPPGWVDALLCVTDRRASVVARGVTVDEAGPLALYRTSIDGASRLGAEVLRAGVDEAYVSIGDAVCAARRHPIRFWNFVPAPSVLMAPGLDRYMVFNGGRYDAYARRYGTTRRFGSSLATSSAVGVAGEDLVIFCLASETPGAPVENPRQKSSWHYSTRYGPQPPCFSRATVVTFGHDRRVLIGGTASIVGEESVCIDDAAQQVEETLANLTALIAAARGTSEPSADDIARLSDVRIYIPRAEHAGTIRSLVAARCPGVTRMELTQSQLCRSELLVEIEGVAELELR